MIILKSGEQYLDEYFMISRAWTNNRVGAASKGNEHAILISNSEKNIKKFSVMEASNQSWIFTATRCCDRKRPKKNLLNQ